MNKSICFCVLYCVALADICSPTGREWQCGDVSSAPAGELCVFTNQRGSSSDERQGKPQWT